MTTILSTPQQPSLKIGFSPKNELKIHPRWIVFSGENSYRTPLHSSFTIENKDSFPVAFLIKSRDRHFPLISQCHGMIPALGRITIQILIPPRNEWPQDIDELTNRRLKLVFENLRISPDLLASCQKQVNEGKIAREVFRETGQFTRFYTKATYVLRRPVEVAAEVIQKKPE